MAPPSQTTGYLFVENVIGFVLHLLALTCARCGTRLLWRYATDRRMGAARFRSTVDGAVLDHRRTGRRIAKLVDRCPARRKRRHQRHRAWPPLRISLAASVAGLLSSLPASIFGKVGAQAAAVNVLLVAGLTYTLAGVHLERPLLWSGLLAFGGYVALSTVELRYLWTITGLVVAASLLLAGLTHRKREPVAKG